MAEDSGEGVEKALENLEKAEHQVERDEEQLLNDQAKVGEAVEELEEAREHFITIIVDKKEREVRPGVWNVAQLKAFLGIDAARVLAEITPHGLKDLDDSSDITLHEGERFMTHARTGGSS
jgi:hypothetical protein